MKVDVIVPNFNARPTRRRLSAPAAERLGYDSVRTTDHIMMPRGYDEPYGHIYESL